MTKNNVSLLRTLQLIYIQQQVLWHLEISPCALLLFSCILHGGWRKIFMVVNTSLSFMKAIIILQTTDLQSGSFTGLIGTFLETSVWNPFFKTILLKVSNCTFIDKLCEIGNETIPKSNPNPKKPWFSDECKHAILDWKRYLRIFKIFPSNANLQEYRIKRAKARQVIGANKKNGWHEYVSKLNTRRSMTWSVKSRVRGRSLCWTYWKEWGGNNTTKGYC